MCRQKDGNKSFCVNLCPALLRQSQEKCRFAGQVIAPNKTTTSFLSAGSFHGKAKLSKNGRAGGRADESTVSDCLNFSNSISSSPVFIEY